MYKIHTDKKISYMRLMQCTWQMYREEFGAVMIFSGIGFLGMLVMVFWGGSGRPVWIQAVTEILTSILGVFASMALCYIGERRCRGEAYSFKEVTGAAGRLVPIAFLTEWLSLILIVCWMLLLVIPGFIKTIRYAFVMPAVCLRGKKYMDAIRYSERLAKRKWWSVSGLIIWINLPYIIGAIIFKVLVSKFGWESTAVDLFGLGCVSLMTSFVMIGSTVLFIALEELKREEEREAIAELSMDGQAQ